MEGALQRSSREFPSTDLPSVQHLKSLQTPSKVRVTSVHYSSLNLRLPVQVTSFLLLFLPISDPIRILHDADFSCLLSPLWSETLSQSLLVFIPGLKRWPGTGRPWAWVCLVSSSCLVWSKDLLRMPARLNAFYQGTNVKLIYHCSCFWYCFALLPHTGL